MFNSLFLKPKKINQQIYDTCLKYTQESIRNITLASEKERNKKQNLHDITNVFSIIPYTSGLSNEEGEADNIIPFVFGVLSISTLLYFFYNRR
jgi:hypothetical protein